MNAPSIIITCVIIAALIAAIVFIKKKPSPCDKCSCENCNMCKHKKSDA